MIPRLKAALGPEELLAALRPPGPNDIERYENAFAALMGQRQAVAFPYGRTGLALLIEALGLVGKEIICPAYTCVVVPHAIEIAGAEPVFVDCRDDDYNMDLDLAESAITEKTGAIIATSIFGYPVDLDKLDAIRARHPHVKIIQDCAHSFKCEWNGRQVQKEGVAAIFGLNISKIVNSIFGGMVTTDDEELATRLRELRGQRLSPGPLSKSISRMLYLFAVSVAFILPVYGIINRMERMRLLDRFVRYYDESVIDMPPDYLVAMTAVEARVGARQLEKYDRIVEHRRRIAGIYAEELKDAPGVWTPPIVEGATYSHYVPRVNDRPRVLSEVLDQGVQLGILIEYSVPHMKAYTRRKSFSNGVSNRIAEETINLPVHCSVSEKDARRIADAVRRSAGGA